MHYVIRRKFFLTLHVINAFIKAQFNYCPLVWMFHDRTIHSRRNNLQERVLRLVCKDSDNELKNLKKKV